MSRTVSEGRLGGKNYFDSSLRRLANLAPARAMRCLLLGCLVLVELTEFPFLANKPGLPDHQEGARKAQ
jgi:hypothetical protein